MHFELLVEDQSGKRMLEDLVPRIVGDNHTYTIHHYKGIGRIPKNLRSGVDANKRILLDQLPRLLQGYGKTFQNYPEETPAAVIVVCDLDDKCLKAFRGELLAILDRCDPKPQTKFCLAIEEGEAWLLGDLAAIKRAYPKAKETVMIGYTNDAICGTWECLADAVYPGGSKALKAKGWQAIGAEKSVWAEKISRHMDIKTNASPSFVYFRETMRGFAR